MVSTCMFYPWAVTGRLGFTIYTYAVMKAFISLFLLVTISSPVATNLGGGEGGGTVQKAWCDQRGIMGILSALSQARGQCAHSLNLKLAFPLCNAIR